MRLKQPLLILGLCLFVAFLAYSVLEYKKTVEPDRGFVTCAEGKCYWSAHVHAWIRIHECGKRTDLPKFTGPLSGPHAHAEENILHWHEKLPADPETKMPVDMSPLFLRTALETLGVRIADSCPDTRETSVKYFVNGVPTEDGKNYRWHDHDIIDIIVDERNIEEARAYIQTLSKQFPTLGEE